MRRCWRTQQNCSLYINIVECQTVENRKRFREVLMRRFITVVKVLRKMLIAMWPTLCQNYSWRDLYQRSLAVVALVSVRAGCVELIGGQFQSQGQKISQRRIHLQNLRDPDGFSWLVKIRADFGSAQNIQLLDGLVARTELLALAGVDSLVLLVTYSSWMRKSPYSYLKFLGKLNGY